MLFGLLRPRGKGKDNMFTGWLRNWLRDRVCVSVDGVRVNKQSLYYKNGSDLEFIPFPRARTHSSLRV